MTKFKKQHGMTKRQFNAREHACRISALMFEGNLDTDMQARCEAKLAKLKKQFPATQPITWHDVKAYIHC
jgi:hypothetical protein